MAASRLSAAAWSRGFRHPCSQPRAWIRRLPQHKGVSYSSMPTTMRAVEISKPGGPEVLRCSDGVPLEFDARGTQVLIEVAAAGINRPDCLQRAGKYPAPPGASPLPGLEVAGRVVAVGEGVDEQHAAAVVRPGARVMALTNGGGYAEYVAVEASHVLPVPPRWSMVDAAAMPEALFTVWSNAFPIGGALHPLTARDDSSPPIFIVHGASGGIGSTAIMLGAAMGARVFATAGSEEKAARCRELGAELVVNYRAPGEDGDWEAAFRAAAGRRGAQQVLDVVGGPWFDSSLKCLGTDGRLSVIGLMGGARVQSDVALTRILLKRLIVTGSTLRSRTVPEKAAIARELERHVLPKLEEQAVAPLVHRTFPLEQASAAHEMLEGGSVVGKLVLRVRADEDE